MTKRRVPTARVNDEELEDWLIARAARTVTKEAALAGNTIDHATANRIARERVANLMSLMSSGCCIMDESVAPTKTPDGEWLH